MKSTRVILTSFLLMALSLMSLYGCDGGATSVPTAVSTDPTPAESITPVTLVDTPISADPTATVNSGGGGSTSTWKFTPQSGTIDNMKITVNSVRTETEGIFKAKEGTEYLILNLTFENSTDKDVNVSALLHLMLTDEANAKQQVTVAANQKPQLESVNGGEAVAGGSVTGEVAYEIAQTGKKFTLSYKPSTFTRKTPLPEEVVVIQLER